jgi:hypothetical protein
MTKDWFFDRATSSNGYSCSSTDSYKSISLEEGECIDSATVWTKAGTTYTYSSPMDGTPQTFTTAGPGSSTVEAMSYSTSKGRSLTWGYSYGITVDT